MSKVKTNQLILIIDTITTLLLALGILILLLWFFVLVMTVAGDTSTLATFEWPIIFSDQILQSFQAENTEFFSRPRGSDLGYMVQLNAVLNPRNIEWPYFDLCIKTGLFIKLCLFVGMIYLFNRILNDIKNQMPFNQANTGRLKLIALLLLALVPFGILENWINHWYIMEYVEMNNIQFISSLGTSDTTIQKFLKPNEVLLSNQIELKPLVFAALIYVLALVFQEGLKLKRDNESII